MTNSRAKGKRVELEAAKFLRELGFDGAARGVQYRGGSDSPDIRCESLPNVHIEVKGDEKIAIDTAALANAYRQSLRDSDEREAAAVLWKRNRTGWRLTFETMEPRLLVTICGTEQIKSAFVWLQKCGEQWERDWKAERTADENPF